MISAPSGKIIMRCGTARRVNRLRLSGSGWLSARVQRRGLRSLAERGAGGGPFHFGCSVARRVTLAVLPGSGCSCRSFAKMMRPAAVVTQLVVLTRTTEPIARSPFSMTTIVPSSRYPTPCAAASPVRRTSTSSTSPGIAATRKPAASALRLITPTPPMDAIFSRFASVVRIR